MVLQGEERGLYGLVLRAEPRQRTVHLVPVQHRPGGSRDAHRSPLVLSCPVRVSGAPGVTLQWYQVGCFGQEEGGRDDAESVPSVGDSHLSYEVCQPLLR
ncbi:hypothetical protein GCM10022207_14610 [Streptomyces lannensis]|uniref:Ig-like domain-containing protein n=1 Tax=Streptomyces lannensis TaxID=766498 RepID=A0ABP7JRZ4_9ACTN